MDENNELVRIISGDTDSLYMSYAGLLNTIEGIENMSQREKLDIIVKINEEFLNQHNTEFMEKYYGDRHVKSAHLFELETVCKKGLCLNAKKRYCQILLWKDGKYFDLDSLPMKIKGLEMIKSSYPKFDREALKRVVRNILETDADDHLWEYINMLVQQEKTKHNQADLEDICASTGTNGYTKYISDTPGPGKDFQILDACNKAIIYTQPKCPVNVRALATYNTIREAYKLSGDPIYGGKVKTYIFKPPIKKKKDKNPYVFAFQSKNYPKWADTYAPIDKNAMFQKYFLDPLNRICSASMGLPPFTIDGSKQMSLFDEWF